MAGSSRWVRDLGNFAGDSSLLLMIETYKRVRGRKLAEQVYHAPSPAGRQATDWGREALGEYPR